MSGTVAHAERAHAELGASSADRWMTCPGSVALSRGLPNPETVYSKEGTAAHELAELALRKGLDPEVYLGVELHGVEVSDEMIEAVRVFVQHVRDRADALGVVPTLEQRFSLESLNPPAPMFGTADVVLAAPTHLEVIDYKHGVGYAVSATSNGQLRYYALGALLAMPKRQAAKIETVTITIVQPRAPHPEGLIRSETLPVGALLAFSGDLLAAAQQALGDHAPLAAGSHCRFCRAASRCPEQLKQAQALAQLEFASVETLPPPVETLTRAQLRQVLEKAPIIESWFKAIRAHIQDTLSAGQPFEGFKLVAKRANRKWKDEAEVRAWLEQTGVPPEEAEERKLKSPAQIEKIVGKKNLPAELTVKEPAGATLAPEYDSRPALAPGHEFGVLDPDSTTTPSE